MHVLDLQRHVSHSEKNIAYLLEKNTIEYIRQCRGHKLIGHDSCRS